MEPKENGKEPGRVIEGPTNPMVTPLLNDLYQFTMAYAYWKAGKQNERSVYLNKPSSSSSSSLFVCD